MIYLIFSSALLYSQSTGGIGGKLVDDSGTIVALSTVTASLQGTSGSGSFPPTYTVKTSTDGTFTFSGLGAGTYRLCAQKPSASLLDPCLWRSQPTMVSVSAGAQAGPVSLSIQRGVLINVQVNDPQGLIAAKGAVDDILIGTRTTVPGTPFLAASVVSKTSTGKLVCLIVPPNLAQQILLSSQRFKLGDALGTALSAASIYQTITTPGLNATATSAPFLTLTVVGAAATAQ